MLGGKGSYGHSCKIKKGGYVVRKGVIAISGKEDVGLFFLPKRNSCYEAGVVHLEARIVYSKVKVLKLSPLTLHANLAGIVPARVLWDKKLKQGVLSVRKISRGGGIKSSLRLFTFF